MTLPIRTRWAAVALAAGALATGCSSTPKSTATTTASKSGVPAWIDKPNGLYDEGSAKVIYAVGVAADNPNPHVARDMAQSRGRAELARTLGVLVEGMVKDYVSTNRDFYEMDTASSVEYFEDISRQVTSEFLVGSQPVEYFRDPVDHTYYALMRLSFEDVTNSYREQMEAAYRREATRKRIKAQADEFEEELDEQLERLEGRQAEILNEELGVN